MLFHKNYPLIINSRNFQSFSNMSFSSLSKPICLPISNSKINLSTSSVMIPKHRCSSSRVNPIIANLSSLNISMMWRCTNQTVEKELRHITNRLTLLSKSRRKNWDTEPCLKAYPAKFQEINYELIIKMIEGHYIAYYLQCNQVFFRRELKRLHRTKFVIRLDGQIFLVEVNEMGIIVFISTEWNQETMPFSKLTDINGIFSERWEHVINIWFGEKAWYDSIK